MNRGLATPEKMATEKMATEKMTTEKTTIEIGEIRLRGGMGAGQQLLMQAFEAELGRLIQASPAPSTGGKREIPLLTVRAGGGDPHAAGVTLARTVFRQSLGTPTDEKE